MGVVYVHWWGVLWGYLVHAGRRRRSHSSMGGGVVGGVALILISCYSLVVTPSWSIKRGEASGFLCLVNGGGGLWG